jgi:hypothetical protein
MREVKISAGATADVAFFVNMSGKLLIAIRTRDGSNEIPEAWWITWGFGGISSLGAKKDSFETPIPVKWWKGVVSARLRARAGPSDTVLFISENSSLDAGISFNW